MALDQTRRKVRSSVTRSTDIAPPTQHTLDTDKRTHTNNLRAEHFATLYISEEGWERGYRFVPSSYRELSVLPSPESLKEEPDEVAEQQKDNIFTNYVSGV